MSAQWRGNLCNSGIDVILDTTLLVLSVCAYLPQIIRLRGGTSTRGLSPFYVLSDVLFSNAQLSNALLCASIAWPTDRHPVLAEINEGRLHGLQAFGGILGLLQVVTQWLCTVLVLMSFAHAGGTNGRNIAIIAFLHAAVVVFPVVANTLPKSTAPSFEKDITLALISISNYAVAPCFLMLRVYAQLREMRHQSGNPGALSLLSIYLEIPVITALGVRWTLRLGRPTWGWNAFPFPIWLWYKWGFLVTNHLLHVLGCVYILTCYALLAGQASDVSFLGDRTPLLTT